MEEDLELESESLQGDMKHSHPVRKTISIKLKASKVKKKSSKSGKVKKEKSSSESKGRERNTSDDRDKSPRRSKSSHHHGAYLARQGKEELYWEQTISLCGQKVVDPVIHTCEKCNNPILVYGRLSRCKHVFCFNCAEAAMPKCPRCDDRIDHIEAAGIDQIFICSFGGSRHGTGGCRKSYLSERDLAAHIKHRHQKDHSSTNSATDVLKQSELQQVQQINSLPFFANQFLDSQQFLRPRIPALHTAPSPMDNRLLLSGLQHREQNFIDAQRMSAPNTFPTMQTSQFQAQPTFHTEQGVARPSLSGAVAPGMEALYMPHSSSGQFPLQANVSRPGSTLAPNTVPYEPNQPYLQGGMPLAQPPGALQPTRLDTGMQGGHVDTVPIPRAMDATTWHMAGPPPQHARPPENWGQQGGSNMVPGYDATRYPPPFYK